MGNRHWTGGGEAFALKLDGKLQAGKEYGFTFTYCQDGHNAGRWK
jgi:hypothetical protein